MTKDQEEEVNPGYKTYGRGTIQLPMNYSAVRQNQDSHDDR